MLILIFRHGEAVDAEEVGGRDEPRMLAAKGRDWARRAAKGMKTLDLIPAVILTSPLPRAKETAQAAAEVFGKGVPLQEHDELKPGADPGAVIGWLEGGLKTGPVVTVGAEAIMVVGHNPDLEDLIAYLIAENGQANISLKKAGLAVITAERPLGQGSGVLLGLWTAKHLDAMAR